MSTFKIKPEKIRSFADIKTLDETHRKVANEFKKQRELIPKKKTRLLKCEKKLITLEARDKSNYTNDDITNRAKLKSEIANLKEEINDVENNLSEIDYYSMTDELLMDYYDIVGHDDNKLYDSNPELKEAKSVPIKQELTVLDKLNMMNKKRNTKSKKVCRKKQNLNKIANKDVENNIYNYFKIEAKDEEKEQSNNNKNRADLFNQYIMMTDGSRYFNKKKFIDTDLINKCVDCDQERTLIRSEGVIVCENCCTFDMVIIESEMSNYNDSGGMIGFGGGVGGDSKAYPYKRRNHFSEWLSQIQARESTEIPDKVYDLIKLELSKLKFTNLKKLTLKKIKSILKRLNLTKYYEHASYIICKLSNLPPPTLDRETEVKLRQMFEQIQIPFERHCPPDRLNFLSYSYILHKFCLLLEKDEFVKYFPLLKSADKLRAQDAIWEKICRDLKWAFHPSI